MNRLLFAAVLTAATLGVARADVPPPDGFKRVPIDYKFTIEKELPNWVVYTVIGGEKVTEVKFDPKNPTILSSTNRGGRYRFAQLTAIPKDAVKQYATEKELFTAVAGGKVPGQITSKESLDAFVTQKVDGAPKTIVKSFKITKIDKEDGIVLEAIKEEKKDKNSPEEEENPVLANTGPAFPWMASGLAAAGIVGFGGLWIVPAAAAHELAVKQADAENSPSLYQSSAAGKPGLRAIMAVGANVAFKREMRTGDLDGHGGRS